MVGKRCCQRSRSCTAQHPGRQWGSEESVRGEGQGQAQATHVGLGAEEVEAILVDGEDAGGRHGHVAAALDEEEGGAEHG